VITEFLTQCKIISITNSIKEETVRIRKTYNIKLPDSIIIATALHLDLPLITSDSDFKRVEELALIHYEKE
jgi:predicted nucleic acid-binding protein